MRAIIAKLREDRRNFTLLLSLVTIAVSLYTIFAPRRARLGSEEVENLD